MHKLFTGLLLWVALAVNQVAQGALIKFDVALSGAQEVGSGDPDGFGFAELFIDDILFKIDWNISVNNIAPTITGAHIHRANAGTNGPVVVNFANQLSGSGLFDADLEALLMNPTGYYVNIHTSQFPSGAIRGQLSQGKVIPEPPVFILMLVGVTLLTRQKKAYPV
ncbi:MAG: CHRD domain-containing protein [Gammaproteobacteria bacterium]